MVSSAHGDDPTGVYTIEMREKSLLTRYGIKHTMPVDKMAKVIQGGNYGKA